MKKLFTLLILLIPIFLFVGCVEVTELDDTKKIELIYSGSYSNFHDFEEPIKWVTSYAEYLESDYSFELNETYFDDYTLYTYSFIYSNLGKNIFLYDDYFLIDNNLLIICDCNEGNVSPAFGNYAIVFGIAKELLSEDTEIIVSPTGLNDMIIEETTEIGSTSTSYFLYFELTEEQEFGINFNREGTWSITNITSRLFNISNKQEISMDMFSGLYGYHAILEPGEYIFILDINDDTDANELFYIFDYHAKLIDLD